jgi:hypothetical protein
MKNCAICNKSITPTFHLCEECNSLYGKTEWAKQLVKIERHNFYMETSHPNKPIESLENIKTREVLGTVVLCKPEKRIN